MAEQLFDFNLLSSKNSKLTKKEKKRNDSTFYAFVFVFTGTVIFLMLILLELILVKYPRTRNNNTLLDLDRSILAYETTKLSKGELFIKSERLGPVLQNDINVNTFLEIAEDIVGSRTSIQTYSREQSGTFVITALVADYREALLLLQNAQSDSRVESAFLRGISFAQNSNSRYQVVLEIDILNKAEEIN